MCVNHAIFCWVCWKSTCWNKMKCFIPTFNNSLYVIVDYCCYAWYSCLLLEVQTLSRKSIYAQCHVWICICVLFVSYLYLSKSKCLSGLVLMLGAMFGVCLAVTFSWLQLWGSQARIIHSQAPGGQPEITDCKYEIYSQNTKTLQIQNAGSSLIPRQTTVRVFVTANKSWYVLTSADIHSWQVLTSGDKFWQVLTRVDKSSIDKRQLMTRADKCW